MKYFWYKILDEEVLVLKDVTNIVPPEFIEFKNGLGFTSSFYKIENGKITEAISEANYEEAAHRRIEELISALNVNLV